jgi:hypothetical protein
MECHWRGTLLLVVGSKTLVLKNSLFIPGSATLIAISYLTNKLKYTVTLDEKGMYLFKDIKSYRSGFPTFSLSKKITDTLWQMPLQIFHKQDTKCGRAFMASMSDDLDPKIIHARYIHCSLPYLQKLYPQLKNCRELPPCDPCFSMVPRKRYMSMYSSESDHLSITLAPNSTFVESMGKLPEIAASIAPSLTTSGETKSEIPFFSAEISPPEEKAKAFFFNDLRDNSLQPSGPTMFSGSAAEFPLNDFLHDPPEPGPAEAEKRTPQMDNSEFAMPTRHDNFGREYGRYFSSDTKTATCQSIRGYNYLFVVIDHDTRVVETFLGVNKNDFHAEVSFFLKNFYNVHKRFPAYWKFDSGGENENHAIIEMFKEMGVDHKFTTNDRSCGNSGSSHETVVG